MRDKSDNERSLEVRDLRKSFGPVRAVDGVSFSLGRGCTLGLVGESGCGKTTVGRCLLRLIEPDAGSVRFQGQDVLSLPRAQLRELRRRLQIVFQDPYGSLDPRMTAGTIVEEPLRIHRVGGRQERRDAVAQLFERVGLSPEQMDRYPHQFSGGQRQRLSIARAIALRPDLIVCDEPVSALDVSVQAQVVNLLRELQETDGLSYLFISHDLAVVGHVSHDVAVMYLGRLVETGPNAAVFGQPAHPYTHALLAASPVPDPTRRGKRIVLPGDVPDPADPPAGCHFHPRCPLAEERCRRQDPEWRQVAAGHRARCWLSRTEVASAFAEMGAGVGTPSKA